MMKVTYLSHSGFLIEMEDAYFLFDYYKGKLPAMDKHKKCFVFVSHSHYDHFKKSIFELRDDFPGIHYVISDDVPVEKEEDILLMGPNEDREVDGCKIHTLRSTDEGVAFLLHYEGKTIYHAGDLNWWHWEEESVAYNTLMRRNYQREINKLQGEKIDVAFVPVDPRLNEQYCWGIDYYMKQTDTKKVFPMHFWGNYGIVDRLLAEKCTQDYAYKICRLAKEGQAFEL